MLSTQKKARFQEKKKENTIFLFPESFRKKAGTTPETDRKKGETFPEKTNSFKFRCQHHCMTAIRVSDPDPVGTGVFAWILIRIHVFFQDRIWFFLNPVADPVFKNH